MTDTLDQLGPVDWLVVEFPGTEYGKGQVAPVVNDLVDRGLIRILDLCSLIPCSLLARCERPSADRSVP